MALIKGITVTLINLTDGAPDGFGRPVPVETEIQVENVLVSPSSTDDIVTAQDLYGKKAVYTLAIPKGDAHIWKDQKVRFFGETWRVFGCPQTGIDALIPLEWNTKWMVERYE